MASTANDVNGLIMEAARAYLNGTATGTSAGQVQGAGASGATAVGNPVRAAGVYNSTLPTLTNGQAGDLQLGSRGSLNVTLYDQNTAQPASVSAFADGASGSLFGILSWVRPSLFNGTTWDRQKKPRLVGRRVSAAGTTNAAAVVGSAVDLFNIVGYNAATTVRYLKLYNKNGAPTVGTDTPFLTIPLAPLASFVVPFSPGLYFSTGLSYALTTGAADADTGAVTAADIVGLNIVYA